MKVAILGAAGVRTPLMIQAFGIRQERTGVTELALMDIDAERLDLIGQLTRPLETSGELKFAVTRTTDARQALHSADFVITTFRVGGMESRVIDERTALDLGVLGQETTGPGGFAMAMRTIPVLLDYVEMMRQECPEAWLINFANPAGMLAEAVLRVAKWERAAGICDAPASMLRVAAAIAGLPADDLFIDYFGLNHLGWIRKVLYQNHDLLPQFLEMMEQAGGFPELPFDPTFVKSMGLIPNEYLFYYYQARQSVHNILASEESRGEMLTRMNQALFADLRELSREKDAQGMLNRYQAYLDLRGQTYMSAETGNQHSLVDLDPAVAEALASSGYAGVALDLMEGLTGGKSRAMILNVLNQGAIWGMEPDDSVEVPAFVGKGFVKPLAVGEIPHHCLGLMQQVKEYERLTIAAAVEGSYQTAVKALAIHPLVADHALAKKLVDGYRQKHGDYFPTLR